MYKQETYIIKPNLPNNKVRKVIIDYRTPQIIIDNLKRVGVFALKSCKVDKLYGAVNGHTDLQIHHLGDKCFTCTPDLYDFYSKIMPDSNLIQGYKEIGSNYPEDIAYNIARIDNYAFGNLKYTDKSICQYYEQVGVKKVNVKQGYAKCNMCIVNNYAVITSDMSIAKALDNYNFDVLLIRQGHIKLEGVSYGFIGGASGLISEDTLVFTGNIKLHPDYESIADFCGKYNVKILSLSNSELVDVGSLIPICC